MNLPNKLTLSRILLIPVFVLFFFLDVMPYHELAAAVIFMVAAFTDMLDGYIARRQKLVTNMGKFLDPIADKVLVSTALILLLTRPVVFTYGLMYGWGIIFGGICISLILGRELIIGGFRLVAVEKGAVIAADKLGKVKTSVQDFSILFLVGIMPFLLGEGIPEDVKNGLCIVGVSLFGLATLLTVISGVNYIVKNRKVLQDDAKE